MCNILVFTTYMVKNKQDGTFTMCMDEISMEMCCKDLQSKGIGYEAQKHEVEDLVGMASGKCLPKITVVKEWEPD